MNQSRELSAGKRRGLQVTANDEALFTILAIDHADDMRVTIRPDDFESVTHEEVVAVKARLMRQLAPIVSAVLVDPVYGLGPAVLQDALPGSTGLMLCIEDGNFASPQRPSRAIDGWSVGQIKKAGGAAVKVYFHYHPDDRNLAQAQEAFVAELVEECRRFDLLLFAEPISYGVSGAERRRVVLESGRRFSQMGADVLKAEFPLDIQAEQDEALWEQACRELSEAIAIPWVLLSAGVDFETFERQLRAACKGGASGYLAGRAIWKDGMMLDGQGQEAFLRETAVARLQALTGLVNKYGRPWTNFYTASKVAKEWYKE